MTNHNNIYSILGKLNSIDQRVETPAPAVKQDSMLKGLSSDTASIANRLNERYMAEKDMGKHNNATTGFKALAKKAGGGEKGERIAGAQFQKMKKAHQLEEYFTFDTEPTKDRGPRDTGTDELERRSKLGKHPLIKHGKDYKEKDKYGDTYKIGGPKSPLPETQLDELSPQTLTSYVGKAAGQAKWAGGVAKALDRQAHGKEKYDYRNSTVVDPDVEFHGDAKPYADLNKHRVANIQKAFTKGAKPTNTQDYNWSKEGGYGDAKNPALNRANRMAEETRLDELGMLDVAHGAANIGKKISKGIGKAVGALGGQIGNANDRPTDNWFHKYGRAVPDGNGYVKHWVDHKTGKVVYTPRPGTEKMGEGVGLNEDFDYNASIGGHSSAKKEEVNEATCEHCGKDPCQCDHEHEHEGEEKCNECGMYESKCSCEDEMDEGEYDDSPNKDDIPAFQRKAKAKPGDDSWKVTQQDLEANKLKNISSRESLAQRSGRELEECNWDSAYSPLPGMRPTSDEEQHEYRHAAQRLRKWMRKRGHNPHHDFKKTLSYIGDNLEEAHDDTLTPDVIDAYHICQKHRNVHLEEGEKIYTKTGLIHKGTYGSDYKDDEGSDDDYDEHGNKIAKSAGRPKKEKQPERVTAKAWKHKGGRKEGVKEHIDLETYVDDTMAELTHMFEGAKVDRMVKHIKSSEKKLGHSDKEAESIAWATANKRGMLDNKNKKKLDESGSMRHHPIYTDKDAWDHYKREMEEEQMEEAMAMGEHAHDDDPLNDLARLAGVNTTPITHAHEHSCNMTAEGQMCPVHGLEECWTMMEGKDDLADKDYDEDGKIETGPEEHAGAVDKAIKKSMGKDKEDVKETREDEFAKARNDKRHAEDEQWAAGKGSGQGAKDTFAKARNDKRDAEQRMDAVKENMEGTTLEDLLALAGQRHNLPPAMGSKEIVIHVDPAGDEEGMDAEEPCPTCDSMPCACDSMDSEPSHLFGEEFANEPHEQFGDVSQQLSQGNDLNRRKTMYKHNYRGGDNPMGTSDSFMEDTEYQRLTALYNQFKKIK